MRFLVENEIVSTIVGIVLLFLAIALGIASLGKDFADFLMEIFTSINMPSKYRIHVGILSIILFLVVMKRSW